MWTAPLRSAGSAHFPSLGRWAFYPDSSLLALGVVDFVTRTVAVAGMQAHIERLEKTRALAARSNLRPVAYSISCGATKLIWVATAAMVYQGLRALLLLRFYSLQGATTRHFYSASATVL